LRDLATDRTPVDIDLAVPRGQAFALGRALSEALAARFVPLHEEFGACRVVLADGTWIDFNDWQGETLDDDLRRRDLTINAIALAWPDGDALHDPTGGLADLADGIARTPSPTSLAQDAVRVLRVFRFAAEFELTVAATTLAEAHDAAPRLAEIAGERVWEEIKRLFAVERAAPWLDQLDRCGALNVLFPELARGAGFAQPSYHHLDVREHSLETARQLDELVAHPQFRAALAGPDSRVVLRLAALLHDIGKPVAAALDADGQQRFPRHSEHGVALGKDIAKRLRLPNAVQRRLLRLIGAHMRPPQLADLLTEKHLTARATRRFLRDLGDDWPLCLALTRADLRATRGPDAPTDGEAKADRLAAHFFQEAGERFAAVRGQPLVTGHDVTALGVPPGPAVAAYLDAVADAHFENPRLTRDEALRLLRALVTQNPP
jgi:poly(A) polymerase